MLIEAIERRLRDAGIRGAPTRDDARLTLHKGAVAIAHRELEWLERDGAFQVHAHVVVKLIGSEQETTLESCVVGLGQTRESALEQAASLWLQLAGAPIFSLLDQRAVLEADHFRGDEPWSISGAHGFMGPVLLRGGKELEALANAAWFRDVPARFPAAMDGRPHLVKGTAMKGELVLELDGQHSSVQRVPFGVEFEGVAIRFALFFAVPATFASASGPARVLSDFVTSGPAETLD